MSKLRAFVGILAVALVASAASADTITTLFAANNSGSAGGGVYFDVTVGALPLEVTSFTTNANSLAGGEIIAFEVYTHAGGHSGFENSPAGWTLEATGTGTAAIRNTPTAVALSNTFLLAANTTVGMALTIGPNVGSAYTTNGVATFSNANVQLDLGTTNNALFGAGLFSPRVWNGSITYNVIPEPATLGLLALGGLALLRRR